MQLQAVVSLLRCLFTLCNSVINSIRQHHAISCYIMLYHAKSCYIRLYQAISGYIRLYQAILETIIWHWLQAAFYNTSDINHTNIIYSIRNIIDLWNTSVVFCFILEIFTFFFSQGIIGLKSTRQLVNNGICLVSIDNKGHNQ